MPPLLAYHRARMARIAFLKRASDAAEKATGAQAQADEARHQADTARQQMREAREQASDLDARIEEISRRIDQLTQAMDGRGHMQAELDRLRADRGKVEDAELEQLERADQLEAELLELDAHTGKLVEHAAKVATEAAEVQDECDQRLNAFDAEIDQAAKQIPEALHKRYDDLCKDGDPMAPVALLDEKRRLFACDGCQMRIPSDDALRLLAEQPEPIACVHCRRLLWMPEDLAQQLRPDD